MDDLLVRDQMLELERTRRSAELCGLLTPVVASSFGVLPVAASDSVITLATVPGGCPERFEVLSAALGSAVRTRVFSRPVVHLFVAKLYPQSRAVNYNTFTSPDFLEDPTSRPALLQEKPYRPVAPAYDPPGEASVYVDISFRGHLVSLDPDPVPNELEFVSSEPARAFALRPSGTLEIYQETPLHEDKRLFLTQSRRHTGQSNEHGIETRIIGADDLPHYIHPTEIQIMGLRPDGSLGLYIYDHVEWVAPEETPAFDVAYYFMTFGVRLHRRLRIAVRRLACIQKDAISPASEDVWTASDMERWLGFDLELDGPV